MHPKVFSKEWFEKYQKPILRFSNTKLGRRVLYIHGNRSSVGKHRITKVLPSCIEWRQDGKLYAEFRTNNRYALRLYHAFKPVWHLFHWWDMTFANRLSEQLNLGFDTFYPDAHPESTSADGYSFRSSTATTFSDLRDSNGNGLDDSGTIIIMSLVSSSTTDRYTNLSRGFAFFDTSSLDDLATVTSAVLSLKGSNKLNDLGSPDLHVAGTTSLNQTKVDQNDYQTVQRASFGSVAYAGFSTTAYNDVTLDANGRSNVKTNDLSRFSLQLSWDLNDNFTGSWVSNSGSRFYVRSADSSGTSSDPKLVVTVELPSSSDMVATSSMSASAKTSRKGESDLIGIGSMESVGLKDSAVNTIDRKAYLYKVYDSSDNFLGIWDDVVSDPNFTQQVNSAGSALEVELARNSDTLVQSLDGLTTEAGDQLQTEDNIDLVVASESLNAVGSGSTVEENLKVEVYVFYGQQDFLAEEDDFNSLIITEDNQQLLIDDGAPNGRKIFTGYISRYKSKYGDNENTLVTVLSYGAEFQNYMLEDSGDTTVAYASQDPSVVLKDILDKFTADGGVADYDNTSVELANTSVSYTFNTNTILEAINKVLTLAPTDWFYYLDMGENIVYLQSKPTVPKHTFILGKHIESLDLEKSIESLHNVIYLTGGDTGGGSNLFKKYTDATSISTYRQGLHKIVDNRLTDSLSADIVANSYLNRHKDPRYRSTIKVIDKVFRIEDIRLGDLVGFANFNNEVDSLTMQVVGLTYNPDYVVLQLDTLLPNVTKRLEDIKRNLEEVNTLANPTAPS